MIQRIRSKTYCLKNLAGGNHSSAFQVFSTDTRVSKLKEFINLVDLIVCVSSSPYYFVLFLFFLLNLLGLYFVRILSLNLTLFIIYLNCTGSSLNSDKLIIYALITQNPKSTKQS